MAYTPLRTLAVSAMSLAFLAASGGYALAKDLHTTPPATFKKVSSLVPLPDFLPGMGTLYVEPSTLPAGPFLGYDRKGKLVNVIYMIPLKQIDERKTWDNLGKAIPGLKVDHTDLAYNPGHLGVAEPHYHITEWLIPHGQEQHRVGDHAGH